MKIKPFSSLRSLTRMEWMLCGLFFLTHAIAYFFILEEAPFFGDERHYDRNAELLLRYIDGPSAFRQSISYHLVGAGYFMPFYSVLIVPFKWLELSDGMIRGVNLFINIGLSLWMVVLIRRMFDRLIANIFLALMAMLPILVLFDLTIFPEATAGKLVLLTLLLFYQFSSTEWSNRRCFYFTICASLLILFRQSAVFIFLPMTLYYLFFNWMPDRGWKSIVRLIKFCLPSTIIVASAIVFWSGMLSDKFGPGYITTTSTDLSFMVLWGEGFDKLGNQAYPSIWRRLHEHYFHKSQREKTTFKEAVSEDKKRVLNNLTWNKYLTGLKRNISTFLSFKGGKIGYIIRRAKGNRYKPMIDRLQYWNWFVCVFCVLTIGLVTVFPSVIQANYQRCLGLILFAMPFLMIHIFVARANSRHGLLLWWTLVFLAAIVSAQFVKYLKNKNNIRKSTDPGIQLGRIWIMIFMLILLAVTVFV